MQMDVRQNLQLYKDMIQCAGPLYLWAYNDCGQLVYSNCPEEEVLAQVFELFGCKKRLYDHLLLDTPMQVPPPSAAVVCCGRNGRRQGKNGLPDWPLFYREHRSAQYGAGHAAAANLNPQRGDHHAD